MSGHSKWSQIKRQKGFADIKKGQVFTKLAAAITIAVRSGGGVTDPNQNFRLRLLVEKARAVNMPKENIQRAINRASSKQDSVLEEVVYEGFTPGGVAVIIDAATDKKLRTTGEMKQLFNNNGATLGNPGSVSYQFQTAGLITVEKLEKSTDEIFLSAADAGALDVEEAGDTVLVYTKPEELASVKDQLVAAGLQVSEFELTRKPVTSIEIEDRALIDKIFSFIEKLESLDDVQKVYTNISIPKEYAQEVA